MNLSARQGYTLIELLITITITTILITFGVNAYRKSSEIQAVKSETEKILIALSQAQKSATTGKRDCASQYLGEQVQIIADTGNLTVTSLCNNDQGSPRTVTLSEMTFTSTQTLLFRPLNQGIDTGISNPLNLDYHNAADTYRIEISKSGTIRATGKL